jgi:hypothetical protein
MTVANIFKTIYLGESAGFRRVSEIGFARQLITKMFGD